MRLALRWLLALLAFATVWLIFGTLMIATIEKSGFAPVVAIVTGGSVGMPVLMASVVLVLAVPGLWLRLSAIVVLAVSYILLVRNGYFHDDHQDRFFPVMAAVAAVSAGIFAVIAPSIRLSAAADETRTEP